jgi:Alpha amylase, catalytic domain
MKFWLDKGADGFRMDVIPFISKDQSFPDYPSNYDGHVVRLDRGEAWRWKLWTLRGYRFGCLLSSQRCGRDAERLRLRVDGGFSAT